YTPSWSACQTSTSPSGTGSPSPSSTWPSMRIAAGVAGSTSRWPPSSGRAKPKKGPTVCEGVSGTARSGFHGRGRVPPQDNVPPVAERPLGNRRLQVRAGHQPVPAAWLGDRLEDRVLVHQ